MSTFANRFKQLRAEKKMTQTELIKDFNLKHDYNFSREAVTQYETNRRIPETEALKAFAKYFEVNVDYLLGTTNIRKEVVTQDDIKLKISRLLLDELNNEGYEITENDIPLLLKSIKFALDIKRGSLDE